VDLILQLDFNASIQMPNIKKRNNDLNNPSDVFNSSPSLNFSNFANKRDTIERLIEPKFVTTQGTTQGQGRSEMEQWQYDRNVRAFQKGCENRARHINQVNVGAHFAYGVFSDKSNNPVSKVSSGINAAFDVASDAVRDWPNKVAECHSQAESRAMDVERNGLKRSGDLIDMIDYNSASECRIS
jgi:hypothetical protein